MTIQHLIEMEDRLEAYYMLVDVYCSATDDIRRDLIAQWNFNVPWKYPNPSRLACNAGETHTPNEKITASLVYYSLNSGTGQIEKEDIIGLAVIYNSCILAGLDADKIFRLVASISFGDVPKFLTDFIKRTPDDKEMDAFWLVANKNSDDEFEITIDWNR